MQALALVLLLLPCSAFVSHTLVKSIHDARPPSRSTTNPSARPLLLAAASGAAIPPQNIRVVVAGATGYIGKYVVKECVRQGYETIAIVRQGSKPRDDFFQGANVCFSDVTDAQSLRDSAFKDRPNVVISCLASRSGVKQDAYAIDYQATKNCLDAARESGADHFVLLSAYCVRKPLLQFQHAKLKFEKDLREATDIKHSIVRPTAFFKSVSGQFELVQQGWPFVMFGDGEICRCNPISETDLATYIVNCIKEEDKWNKVLDIGGPDNGLTPKEQGELLFNVLRKEPKFWKFPVQIFDAVIGGFEFLAKFSAKMEDAAELARIGKYYAVEDMLTTSPNEKFGSQTLRQHYERIAVEGQEYDPYTTMLASKKP